MTLDQPTLVTILALGASTVLTSGVTFLLRRAIDGVDKTVAEIAKGVQQLGEKLDGHNARLAVLETRLAATEKEIESIRARLHEMAQQKKGRG